ncbi:S8 family serine peptidase [Actinomadura flavalba]|uniref:S8 family serine peptidase n=1 Tax=Actinomadura flavalba TaxID=1120938 RepID=UPI0003672194|nr:S8 family serine peptidase [Actinomadura flavalba]
MTRWLAACGASALTFAAGVQPVDAAPPPAQEQWWFAAWEMQQKVWPVSKGGGVTVAVIDTGVNAQLPDLRSAVVPGANIDRGSGDGMQDPADGTGHGTQMASLIASRGTTTNFYGVAPEAKVMPIVSTRGNTAEAIQFAIQKNVQVINISQGYPGACTPDLQQAISQALSKNIVVVAAAGNSGDVGNTPERPANCAGVLAVGAIDNEKRVWTSSQRQPYVAVAAPGIYVGGISNDGRVLTAKAGTSPASALTSATAALMRSKNPQMPAREVVQRLYNTAKDAGPPGRDDQTGNGVIIPAAALTAQVPKSAPNPVFDRYDKWLAAQPKQPQSTAPQPKSTWAEGAEEAEGRTKMLLIGVVGGGLLIVLIVGAVLVIRSGKKKPPPGPPSGPPSFGGPPPAHQAPPPHQGHQGPGPSGPYGGPQTPQPGHPPYGPPGGSR